MASGRSHLVRPLLLSALFALAGCPRPDARDGDDAVDEAIEASSVPVASGLPADDRAADEVVLETEDGPYTARSGDDLPLPAQFPHDVVLPAGAHIRTSAIRGDAVTLSLYGPQEASRLLADFARAQRAAGWREQPGSGRGGLALAKAGRLLEAEALDDPGGGATLVVSVRPLAD